MHDICNDCIVFGMILFCIPYAGFHFMRWLYKRAAKYDCSRCKVWDCDALNCSRMREKKNR